MERGGKVHTNPNDRESVPLHQCRSPLSHTAVSVGGLCRGETGLPPSQRTNGSSCSSAGWGMVERKGGGCWGGDIGGSAKGRLFLSDEGSVRPGTEGLGVCRAGWVSQMPHLLDHFSWFGGSCNPLFPLIAPHSLCVTPDPYEYDVRSYPLSYVSRLGARATHRKRRLRRGAQQ